MLHQGMFLSISDPIIGVLKDEVKGTEEHS